MPGFFRSLQPLLRFGLGLFVLALLGGLAQAVARWIEVPFAVILIVIGVIGLLSESGSGPDDQLPAVVGLYGPFHSFQAAVDRL
jgi:hypothetical protein